MAKNIIEGEGEEEQIAIFLCFKTSNLQSLLQRFNKSM